MGEAQEAACLLSTGVGACSHTDSYQGENALPPQIFGSTTAPLIYDTLSQQEELGMDLGLLITCIACAILEQQI
jgi:hypothetical protein